MAIHHQLLPSSGKGCSHPLPILQLAYPLLLLLSFETFWYVLDQKGALRVSPRATVFSCPPSNWVTRGASLILMQLNSPIFPFMNHGLDLAKDSLCDPRSEYFLLTPKFQNFSYVLVPVLMPVCAGSWMEDVFSVSSSYLLHSGG